MSYDYLQVSAPPSALLEILRKYDARGETYEFVAYSDDHTSTTLTLIVEGAECGVEVVLREDGTWNAKVPFIVGEVKEK